LKRDFGIGRCALGYSTRCAAAARKICVERRGLVKARLAKPSLGGGIVVELVAVWFVRIVGIEGSESAEVIEEDGISMVDENGRGAYGLMRQTLVVEVR